MEEMLVLPVTVHGQDYEFQARIIKWGYTYRIAVDIFELTVQFERDEENNWRAVMDFEDLLANKKIPHEIIEAISGLIDEITK